MMNTSINLGFRNRPLRNKKGTKINDYETAKYGLQCLQKIEKETGEPAKISPKFREWLEEGVNFVESKQGNFSQYKKKTIMRVLDIGAILENTEKRNNELSKKGLFNTKIVKQEEGKV